MRRLAAWALAVLLPWSAPALAAVEIDISGVDDALRNNVLTYLSLSRYRDRDLDAAMVERLHQRIEGEVDEALRPFGYYQPVVHTEVEPTAPHSWKVSVHIDPGPPVIISTVDVRVTGPGGGDPRFQHILAGVPMHPGERLSHPDYDHTKNDLLNAAATYGWLDARLTHSELRVDPEKHTASEILWLETGERYRFGTTTIDQHVISAKLVQRFLRFHEGEYFDLNQLLRTQFALDDSQYFASVEVQPGDPDRVHHIVPVSIHASASRRDRYQFGGGYGTDTGPRGTLMWDRRLINDSGHRLSFQLEASPRVQQLQSQYIIPIGDPALERLALGASIVESTPGDLRDKDFAAGPSVTMVQDRWQSIWALTPMYSVTENGYTTQRDRLLVPSVTIASVPRGYLGEALFERGLTIELRAAARWLGSSESFAQLHVNGERVFNFADHWHLLLRGEAGASLVSKLSQLPGSFRFFAGGDQSVRGFSWDELSPVVTERNPNGTYSEIKVGGREVLTGTVEVVRDLPHNLGLAVFSDAGNAFDVFGHSPNPQYPHFIEYSVGAGLRWRLPVVTFGIDIAQPLSRNAGPRLHINFSPKLGS